jgi:2-dehydro-3-deoxy-D-arabinonate dehydratase
MAIWRVRIAEGERLARGSVEAGADRAARGRRHARRAVAADSLDALGHGPVPVGSSVLAPIQGQEVWAAGVTYSINRSARNEGSGGHDL